MKLKDVSMIGSPIYERIENDAYYTRDIMLMDALWWFLSETPLIYSNPVIWEPFAGAGHITNYLTNRTMKVFSSDINPNFKEAAELDYYNLPDGFNLNYNMVVTNPPFEKKLSEQFVRDMVKKCEGKDPFTFAVLLRNEWDCAGTRLDIFDSPYYDAKVVITKRPRWIVKTEGDSSPRHNYSWFIFTNQRKLGPPKISYYHPSKDSLYEKIGRTYKRSKHEIGHQEYIYT